MPQFLIERHFGPITPEQLQEGGSASKRAVNEQFPEIVWEHSHVLREPAGLMTYCIYTAPDEDYVRKHAAAAGLPIDRITILEATVGPGDFA